jgi:hypothetical protein
VLRAGCTGVRFLDLRQLSIAQPKRFRTLRGIEEVGEWDPKKKIAPTRVVEPIN